MLFHLSSTQSFQNAQRLFYSARRLVVPHHFVRLPIEAPSLQKVKVSIGGLLRTQLCNILQLPKQLRPRRQN